MAQAWSHQPPAIQHMLDNPATLLEAWMGTGKTYMTMSVIDQIQKSDAAILILCPATVVGVWSGQAERHFPGRFNVLPLDRKAGTTKEKERKLHAALKIQRVRGQKLIVVVNYESAILEPLKTLLLLANWDIVICDESQRIKGHNTQIGKLAAQLHHCSKKRICLTGTPMPHGPGDIFSQYRFLDPSIFGKYWTHFTRQYAVISQHIPGKVDKWVRQDEMRQKIAKLRYHIPKDVLVLPERQDITIECELGGAGRKAYIDMLRESILEVRRMIDGGEDQTAVASAMNGGVKFLRLLQLAQGYVKTEDGDEVVTDSSKRRELLDLLDQTDEPVCVYGWFRHDLEIVKTCCEMLGRRYGEISGSRKDLGVASTMPDDIDVMAVQCKSGGSGIDLTRARIGIVLNTGFISPGDYDQMMARQYRPGQTKNVVFYHLLTKGTVDTHVMKSRQQKRDVVQALIEDIGKMSSDNGFLQNMAVNDALSAFFG